MPHLMELKDGTRFTPLCFRDVMDVVEEHLGEEVRTYIEEEYTDLDELEDEIEILEKDREEDLERQGDHYRAVLCDIWELAETLADLLDADRMDRKKLRKATDEIWSRANQEL